MVVEEEGVGDIHNHLVAAVVVRSFEVCWNVSTSGVVLYGEPESYGE